MSFDQLHELRPGVYSVTDRAGNLHLTLRRPWPTARSLGPATPAKRALLARLAAGPCGGGLAEPDAALLRTLLDGGWLMTTVRRHGRALYTLQPIRPPRQAPPEDPERVVLSRFSILHRSGDALVVESPLASHRLRIADGAVLAILGDLTKPIAVGGAGEVPARVLRDLHRTGLAVSEPDAEDSELPLRQWSAPDLWFHGRSRAGNGGYDGTGFARTHGAGALPEASEPRPAGTAVVGLPRPDLHRLRATDPPLAAVLEDRRSIRAYDEEAPITADQLGELLYRCARDRGAGRPYPSGGSAYELEVYPVVRRARGLGPGLYHYDTGAHRLSAVRSAGPETDRLLATAAAGASLPVPPQVLLVLSARFGRLMRRYEEIPYSLILKHVGVLSQSFYLAATAMGLAVCAIGAGDSAAFSAATGFEMAVEGSVGELALGSRPPA